MTTLDNAAPLSTDSALRIADLGLISYPDALQIQTQCREDRLARRAPDTLLLLEHPPTITIGRSGNAAGLLSSTQELEARGFQVYPTERGGLVTYHGPGQLVGYVIIDLSEMGIGVHEFMRRLEQVVIDTLEPLGISACRLPGYTGVWVENRKIAAFGVHIKRWITIHGLALNVNPDLSHFQAIVPCGIDDKPVTSILAERGQAPSISEVKVALAENFSRIFLR